MLEIYLFVMNMFLFVLCGEDKRRAKRHAYRVRERTLMILALLGGALGLYIGMLVFHHKVRKPKFRYFVPIIILIQILIYINYVSSIL